MLERKFLILNKLVTVIMPVYNEKKQWIVESVNSIIKQTYANIEFIIICDSTDNQLKSFLQEISKKGDNIKIIFNPRNLGLVNSLNRGINLATGEFIARMDADDVSLPERIETEVKCINAEKVDLVFSEVNVINESGKLVSSIDKKNNLNEIQLNELFRYGNVSKHPTWLGRSELFKELMYRNVSYTEDMDFLLRGLQEGKNFFKIAQPLLNYRVRDNSISRTNDLKQFLISRKLRKLFKNNELLIGFNSGDLSSVSELKKKEKAKFSEGNKLLGQSFEMIKNRNFVNGLITLIKSLFYSKYVWC